MIATHRCCVDRGNSTRDPSSKSSSFVPRSAFHSFAINEWRCADPRIPRPPRPLVSFFNSHATRHERDEAPWDTHERTRTRTRTERPGAEGTAPSVPIGQLRLTDLAVHAGIKWRGEGDLRAALRRRTVTPNSTVCRRWMALYCTRARLQYFPF